MVLYAIVLLYINTCVHQDYFLHIDKPPSHELMLAVRRSATFVGYLRCAMDKKRKKGNSEQAFLMKSQNTSVVSDRQQTKK